MEPILHSYAYSLDYLRELIADVPDDLMAVQPEGIANHPAWTIGHLVFIARAIGGVIGVEPWLTGTWERQFGSGSKPSDLSSGSPTSTAWSKNSLLNALDTAQAKLTAAVAALSDAQLDAPFPDPSYADVFPTVGHALTQVLLGHTAFHIGQLSVWRRAMNLSPIARSYE